MTAITHAFTMNGRIHGELKDPVDSPEVVVRKRIGLLDGVNRYALSVWRLPEGIPFDRVDLTFWPQEYIQVAGSQMCMTVEVRQIEDGVPRQYVVGRSTPGQKEPDSEVAVPWDAYEARVFANEVFDADEAADLFAMYLATDGVPEGYSLRQASI